jgi:hypothetical protein
MPKETTVLQVFVASPSDVNDERKLLDSVVAELNRTWSNSLGVTLELLKWETHTYPSFGTDPQAVINEQINQDYDAFIGIFWSKIGTETSRAISGSVEEFERAYARWRINNKSPEIMIYFKDEPIPPSKIDAKQIAALQEFKNSMSAKGGMYSQFEDVSGFESSIRSHLSAIAQKFAASCGTFTPAYEKSLLRVTVTVDDNEYDQLDYFAINSTRTKRVTGAYHTILAASTEFANQIIVQTEKLSNITNSDIVDKQIILSDFAKASFNYSEILKVQVRYASNSRKIALNALSKALSFIIDSEKYNIQLTELKRSLVEMVNTNSNTQSNIQLMKLAIIDLPDEQLDFDNAKKLVSIESDFFINELKSSSSNLNNIIVSMDKILNNVK